jgi:hypothetical protein
VKRGAHHTEETRDRMRERNLTHWTADERAKASELTRRRMDNPLVREKISAATKEGLMRWRQSRLDVLREEWRKSDKQTRAVFFLEIAASLLRAAK